MTNSSTVRVHGLDAARDVTWYTIEAFTILNRTSHIVLYAYTRIVQQIQTLQYTSNLSINFSFIFVTAIQQIAT